MTTFHDQCALLLCVCDATPRFKQTEKDVAQAQRWEAAVVESRRRRVHTAALDCMIGETIGALFASMANPAGLIHHDGTDRVAQDDTPAGRGDGTPRQDPAHGRRRQGNQEEEDEEHHNTLGKLGGVSMPTRNCEDYALSQRGDSSPELRDFAAKETVSLDSAHPGYPRSSGPSVTRQVGITL